MSISLLTNLRLCGRIRSENDKRKITGDKMKRIDKIKSVVAVLLLLCIVALTSCQTNIEPKEFKTGVFSILLDTGFKEIENEAAIAFFTSSKYSVICVKEDFSSLEKGSETTVLEYGEIIKNNYRHKFYHPVNKLSTVLNIFHNCK